MSGGIACNGTGGDFKWRYHVGEDHVQAGVDALMGCIARQGRNQTEELTAYNRAMFTRSLRRAEAGKLKPEKEVKSIRPRDSTAKLYEIRWNDIRVINTGNAKAYSALVRLYYAEPESYGLIILGLHCHEKQTLGLDSHEVNQMQDIEIEHAFESFYGGMQRHWGIDLK